MVECLWVYKLKEKEMRVMESYLQFWYSEEDERKYGYDMVKDDYGSWCKYTVAMASSYDYSKANPDAVLVHEGRLQDCEIRYARQNYKSKTVNPSKFSKDIHFELEDLTMIATKLTKILTITTTIDDLETIDVDNLRKELEFLSREIDKCLQSNDRETFSKLSKQYNQIKQML
jgi:hypothetical protein